MSVMQAQNQKSLLDIYFNLHRWDDWLHSSNDKHCSWQLMSIPK
ncbi:hypothetical protein THF1C08_320036 [Vibrio jasicida]|uniref:Uncharacterized protein n=1 Tax=Vibrio jasicida TaxID=766224 RepID=A0AAU9QPA7_9VIBR|nr:hypothetical protein THF1C08_320036 [Vibrio jasicida]CAH1597388.1 hypothetical protein THF1A12_320036 [Vibrio jasicida]